MKVIPFLWHELNDRRSPRVAHAMPFQLLERKTRFAKKRVSLLLHLAATRDARLRVFLWKKKFGKKSKYCVEKCAENPNHYSIS